MANPQSGKMSPGMMFVMLISGGLTFYFMFEYIGPFQWLAEWQLRAFGSYSEKLTFLVTFLGMYGVVLLLAWPLPGLFPSLAAGNGAGGSQLAAGWVILVVIGSGFGVFGLYKLQKAREIRPLQIISLHEVELGHTPSSLFATASGFPVVRDAVSFGKDAQSQDLFVPFVSASSDTQSQGARIFLKLRKDMVPSSDSGQTASFNGILEKNDLPGPVRTEMERSQALIGNDYYVLEVGQTPATKQTNATIMAYVGGGMMVIGLIIGAVSWMRRTKVN